MNLLAKTMAPLDHPRRSFLKKDQISKIAEIYFTNI